PPPPSRCTPLRLRFHSLLSFLLLIRPPPSSTLFPYTTLFRSRPRVWPDRRSRQTPRRMHRREIVRHRRPKARVARRDPPACAARSEEHTSELQSLTNLVCRLLLEKKKQHHNTITLTQHHQPPS